MADDIQPTPSDDDAQAPDSPTPPTAGNRRRVPGWLVPSVAALAIGLLVGALLFGGSHSEAGARTPTATASPSATAPGAAPAAVTSLVHAEPVEVDLPSIGVSSTLVDLGLNADGTLEVPKDFSRAGWFTGGSAPGDPPGPPAVIAGHVDDYTGPAVFFELRKLVVGDQVQVVRADNTVAVFVVSETHQYPKDAFPADEVYAPADDSELILITCTGGFDQEARSYLDNLVVRAKLDVAGSLAASDARAAAGTAAPAADQPNV